MGEASIAAEASADMQVGIGDVSKVLGLPAHTLRFWEREFPFYLSPPRTVGRQRRYDDGQLSRLVRVRHLLKEKGFSIAGARRILRSELEGSIAGQTRGDPLAKLYCL